METFQGLLKIRVQRGVNLAVRDVRTRTSDPYVVISMAQQIDSRKGVDKVEERSIIFTAKLDFEDYEHSKTLAEVIEFNHRQFQRLATRVVKKNCNPVWNEDFTLSISNLNTPITLTVYDKDKFTEDDKMGDADIDIKPYIECLQMGLKNLPNGCAVKRIQPDRSNCLSDESSCVWNDGKIVQDMPLRLRNVECGEVMIQIELIVGPQSKRYLAIKD